MQLSFQVNESCYTASGASYVVKYRAKGQTNKSGLVTIKTESVLYPEGTDQDFIDSATQHMREGFELVALDQNIGVELVIYDLFLHPVDYKSYKQRQYSACYLAKALGHEEPGKFYKKASLMNYAR